jgi:hypothetical protein
LLDDERDAAEEEKLAQLVHIQVPHQQQQQRQQQQQQEAAGRRSQREAARRAAERIALEQLQQPGSLQASMLLQQQQIQEAQHRAHALQQQQQQQLHDVQQRAQVLQQLLQQQVEVSQHLPMLLPGQQADLQQQQQGAPDIAGTCAICSTDAGVVLPPLIPATAVGLAAAAEGDVTHLSMIHNGLDNAALWPQQSLQHGAAADDTAAAGLHLPMFLDADSAAAAAGAVRLFGHPMLTGTADTSAAAAMAAAAADAVAQQQVAEVLTLKDTQLQQLYHQVTLHTQLLTQMYVLTARDPSPTSQAVASSAGQMLGDIRRLHAATADSYRGQQLAQLLQQAFSSSSDEAASASEQQAATEGQNLQQQQQHGGLLRVAAAAAGVVGRQQRSSSTGVVGGWQRPFKDIG